VKDPVSEIDALVQDVLQRPKMFSSSPESLEESLYLLEVLRERLRPVDEDQQCEFTNYLIDKGYSAMCLNDVAKSMNIYDQDDRFEFVVKEWTDFLISSGRSRRGEAS